MNVWINLSQAKHSFLVSKTSSSMGSMSHDPPPSIHHPPPRKKEVWSTQYSARIHRKWSLSCPWQHSRQILIPFLLVLWQTPETAEQNSVISYHRSLWHKTKCRRRVFSDSIYYYLRHTHTHTAISLFHAMSHLAAFTAATNLRVRPLTLDRGTASLLCDFVSQFQSDKFTDFHHFLVYNNCLSMCCFVKGTYMLNTCTLFCPVQIKSVHTLTSCVFCSFFLFCALEQQHEWHDMTSHGTEWTPFKETVKHAWLGIYS